MKVEKLLIEFRSGANAYERNMHIKHELENRQFVKILKGKLIYPDGTSSDRIYENKEIEEAESVEIDFI